MSTPPPPKSQSTLVRPASVQGLRLLGHAIAFAAVTGLLAYGCEKAESQKKGTAHPSASQPKPAPPPPPPAEPVKQPAADPAKEPAKEPTPPVAKPADIGAGMVQGEKPKPSAEPDPNKPKPIPHEDLAKDAKPLTEFTTPTKVIVQEFKMGQGPMTLPKAVVRIHFVLHLKDGWKKIQSTYDDGEAELDTLDEVVLGMADGIVGMQPGGSRRIIVPPDRGFAAKGVKDKDGAFVIPPDSTLVYDVDLISNRQMVVEGAPHKAVTPKFSTGRKEDGGK